MSAPYDRKDELAARALARLGDPPVPEGLAARIAARATALPQMGAIASGVASDDTPPPHPVTAAGSVTVASAGLRARRPGRHLVAASVAAAALLSLGVYAVLPGQQEEPPVVASGEETRIAPQPDASAPPRLADTAPRADAIAPARRHRDPARPPVGPAMELPVPATAPVELAAGDPPGNAPAPAAVPVEKEKIARTGPENLPNAGLRPVYGPPAPVGLGIAGGPGSTISLPNEPPAGNRAPGGGAPSGAPPSGIPGPGAPRGPGPRL